MSCLPISPVRFYVALTVVALAILSSALPQSCVAADAGGGFTVEKSLKGVTVKFNGEIVAKYVIDQANKPYLWPLIGPTGKPMTRAFPMAEVAGEDKDHPHHRSVWFGHEEINHIDTWTETRTWEKSKAAEREKRLAKLGAIRHREFREVSGGKEKAVVVAVDDFVDSGGKKLFEDEHRITFRMAGEARWLDYDIEFLATEGPVEFGDVKDAGFNVRVAHSIAVDTKRGGRIVNSEGLTDAAAWGQRAKWVDYHGPVEDETVGIAILDHPSNFRHPTPWHVRTYGLFTANPFGTRSLDKSAPDGKLILAKGERLKLRYRVILHKGDEKAGQIAQAFEDYARDATN